MKKFLTQSIAAIAVASFLSGCGTTQPIGIIYTGVTSPVSANNNVEITKTGEACSYSIFHLVSFADASIAAAKANGGIKNVATVDYQATDYLGAYGKYCTIVSGN